TASAKAPAAPDASAAPTTQETISADWDPQVQFRADENVAVRRFVRLKNLKPAPAPPKVDGIVYNPIDQFVVAKWNAAGFAKPQAASTQASTRPTSQPVDPNLSDDTTFVRRVYLDLIGMIPTADEAGRFVEDKDTDKRT